MARKSWTDWHPVYDRWNSDSQGTRWQISLVGGGGGGAVCSVLCGTNRYIPSFLQRWIRQKNRNYSVNYSCTRNPTSTISLILAIFARWIPVAFAVLVFSDTKSRIINLLLTEFVRAVLGEYRPSVFLVRTSPKRLGPYCQDLGPIFSQYGPRTRSIRYIYFQDWTNMNFSWNSLSVGVGLGLRNLKTLIIVSDTYWSSLSARSGSERRWWGPGAAPLNEKGKTAFNIDNHLTYSEQTILTIPQGSMS